MYPFNQGDTFSLLANNEAAVKNEINSLENDYILNVSLTELEESLVSKYWIEPLVLHKDSYYIENTTNTDFEVTNDFRRAVRRGRRAFVPGTMVLVAVPYEGDDVLWSIRPSTFSICAYPDITVRENTVLLRYSFPDDAPEPDSMKKNIERDVQLLYSAVGYLKQDIDKHNSTIAAQIKRTVETKHSNALKALNAVSSLGIPIKRSAAPDTYRIPTKRKRMKHSLPRTSTESYTPEPALDLTEYDNILKILRDMTLVLERSPKSLCTMNEEAIRTHFLVQLNGQYEGSATGETFNASGKTDILIRVDNKNVFIAECKFWKGPSSFDKTITQLLSYLSWRDSKCAIIIFNRNKNSTEVRKKMHLGMESRPEHVKTLLPGIDNDGRYIYRNANDPGREITITTMLFDIPNC